MKRIINRILKIISTSIFVVLILIIGFILFYVVQVQVLTSQGRVDEVKLNFYTILTQSMYPTISAGDIVITYKNENNIYNVGDIITFVSTSNASKGLTITHRIVEVFELDGVYSYKTQGDNNNVADSSSVPSKNVVGRTVFKIPKAGYIQQFLVTKVGWIVAIVVPCLGIIIYDILKMLKTLAGKNKNNKVLVDDKKTIEAKEKLNNVLESKSSLYDKIDDEEMLSLRNGFDSIRNDDTLSTSLVSKDSVILEQKAENASDTSSSLNNTSFTNDVVIEESSYNDKNIEVLDDNIDKEDDDIEFL